LAGYSYLSASTGLRQAGCRAGKNPKSKPMPIDTETARYMMFHRVSCGRKGIHQVLHRAGCDLTEALKEAPHGPEILNKFPVVGELVDSG